MADTFRYVDCVNGSDANSGTSRSSAKATITAAMALAPVAGADHTYIVVRGYGFDNVYPESVTMNAGTTVNKRVKIVSGLANMDSLGKWGASFPVMDGSDNVSGTGAVVRNTFPTSVSSPDHTWNWNYGALTDSPGTNKTAVDLTLYGTGNSLVVDWADRLTNSLSLDGNGYAQVSAYSADLNNPGPIFSILIDFNPASITGTQVLAGVYGATAGWAVYLADDDIKLATYNGGWNSYTLAAAAVVIGKHYQLLVTVGLGSANAYLNSVNVGTVGSILTPVDASSEMFTIGATAAGASNLTGTVHRVSTWKGIALTAANVEDIYAEWCGLPVDVTLPQHCWDFMNSYIDTGASATRVYLAAGGTGNSFVADWAGRAAHALSLDGSGYAVAGSNHADLDNIGVTFSILCEFTAGADVTTLQYLVNKFSVTGNKRQYGLYILNGEVVLATCLLGTTPTLSNPVTVAASSKYQLIATLNGSGGATLYLNGVANTIKTGMETPLSDATYKMTIGARADDYSSMFTGTIHRAAILKGTSWTPADVAAIYGAWVDCSSSINSIFARWYQPYAGGSFHAYKILSNVYATLGAAGTWGSESAGEYSTESSALRYYRSTTDPVGSPGLWESTNQLIAPYLENAITLDAYDVVWGILAIGYRGKGFFPNDAETAFIALCAAVQCGSGFYQFGTAARLQVTCNCLAYDCRADGFAADGPVHLTAVNLVAVDCLNAGFVNYHQPEGDPVVSAATCTKHGCGSYKETGTIEWPDSSIISTADPLFNDVTIFDFGLQSASPLIGIGTTLVISP